MSGEFKGIWVYLERRGDQIIDPSIEVLGKARELAEKSRDEIVGIILGYRGLDKLGEVAIQYGSDKVYIIEDPVLEEYSTIPYAEAISRALTKYKPNIILYPATRNGRDLAGRISAKLNLGLSANTVWLDISSDGVLLAGVPGFGGAIMAVTKCLTRPQMATVRPGVFPKPQLDPSRRGSVERIDVGKIPEPKIRVVERTFYEVEDISKAEAIVVAGVGLRDNVEIVKKLAEELGWKFGATRPLSDEGLVPRDIFIGATGKVVKPKIALIIGVSGAAHFISGITGAEKIISINIDPEAPIHSYSDYSVTGDGYKIVPKLLEKIRGE
ncbi:MAG: electron transfer flavoprotein subunit alpha/FixB family protein [Aigarchaeota archaeon]|nr:electron transfer flavoprotein subunit alpha/FixB family protein [Aigarchaeota archaeon]MCX8193293.1 electron transfer flavoprotein subunit alpha/FixB family protein [Nitrososphaeria archaeon]MDW7986512.1 electron transfer flavoprotein subunit alpha/FixB family protein [Nitrososphaerota archaeon]